MKESESGALVFLGMFCYLLCVMLIVAFLVREKSYKDWYEDNNCAQVGSTTQCSPRLSTSHKEK